jgi:ParB-like chromosome segregation protein Spo0J
MSKINSEDHQAKYDTVSKVAAHPALTVNEEFAELIPPLPDSDYEALKLSIKQNGQYDPIDVNQDGIILDGHHQFRACEELKIEPTITRREFKDSLLTKQFIIETNSSRRHLTTFQRVELQVKLETIESELAKKRLVEAGKMGAERRWKKEARSKAREST